MGDPKDRPPREPGDAGRSTEPPPPFNPRLDLIVYLDSDARGIPEKQGRIWNELWREGFWRDFWHRFRRSKSKT